MRIGYVCTNYNGSRFSRAAVESLLSAPRAADIRIVVVDNRSRNEDRLALQQLTREYPAVELVLSDQNVGYFAGLNLGLERLRAASPDIEHVVVGNNDLEFPASFVDQIEEHRDVFGTWAVVAPDLVTPEGVHQNPHVRHPISRARKLIWELYYSSYPVGMAVRTLARLTRRFTIRDENAADAKLYLSPGPVEQGYGACYLLGPLFFRNFKRLYSPTFMMQEEFFLYEQLGTIGQSTYYDPRFVVHHTGHATMNTLPSRRQWALARDAHVVYRRYLALPSVERRRLILSVAGR